MPTGSASSQLSQWQRLNAGLSGPLAFEQDFSALDDPAASHDAAYAHEPYDFHDDGTPPTQPIDLHLLLSRFRSLDLRVRVLEAERSGAQQALWHHHRAATDSQRLRSLISPWAYMSSKVDAIRVSLQRALSRLSGYRAVSTNLYFREKNFRIFVMRKFRLEVLAHPEGWECKIFLVAKVLRE